MTGLLCDPAQEKEVLYIAIDALHKQWGKPQMAEAYTDLHVAVARTERALSVLEPQQDKGGIAFYLAWGTLMRGWALAEQGQVEEGIAQMH